MNPGPPVTRAVVVAGGAGERMRRSGSDRPKPLVVVGGRTLLEHNVAALLAAGFRDLHVAVAAAATDVRACVAGPCAAMAAAAGAAVAEVVEDVPLGSLGAVALVAPGADDVVVTNADNLTALDLAAVLRDHRTVGADLTLAVHDEPFPMAFGEITMDGERVTAYREKPTYMIRICTAVTVLGRGALDLFEVGENVGLPVFANRVLDAGLHVHGHLHEAAWIDVNDLAAAARAEELLAAEPDRFRPPGGGA